MPGTFELSKNAGGQFSFVLKASNGETILRSEQYAAKASATNGIASVQANAGEDARFEKLDAKDGRCYFNLKATNGQVIGTSQMYASAAARDAGIASVRENAAGAATKDLTG